MNDTTLLEKRIRRHVIGRVREFFAATAPGLENLCRSELSAPPVSAGDARIIPGGAAFTGRLIDCYKANLFLRIPNRILMRIGKFGATSFGRLEKKIADMPWELFLFRGTPLRFSVSASHSRLFHKTAIAERFREGIRTRLGDGQTEKTAPVQTLFIRAEDDRFTVSIDSSGDLLYKRGVKTRAGPAPIRETLAAAALQWAGFTGTEPLIDPMCGAGTFSIEAALMAGRIAPGFYRTFAFTGWPSFMPLQWDHLRRKSAKNHQRPESPLIFASDRDETACRLLAQTVLDFDLSPRIRVGHRDFFSFSPRDVTDRVGIVTLNPPYGRRLGTRKESLDLFRKICGRLKACYTGWKAVLIVPDPQWVSQVPVIGPIRPIAHGGLKLAVAIGTVR